MYVLKKQKNMEEMFFLLEIMAFECDGVAYVYCEVNPCDRQSTFYETVLRSQIWLEDMFSNCILFPINVKLR